MGAGARAMCPICGRDAMSRAQNAAFPFCSPQCKLVDLGRWLEGAYRVPGPPIESMGEGLEDDSGTDGARRDRDSEEDG